MLHVAAMNNSVGTVKLLLRMSSEYTPPLVDIDAKNQWGETALHIAAATGQTGLVHCLLESGASPHAADMWGRTPMKVVFYYIYNK